jgi:hypothetical protein
MRYARIVHSPEWYDRAVNALEIVDSPAEPPPHIILRDEMATQSNARPYTLHVDFGNRNPQEGQPDEVPRVL